MGRPDCEADFFLPARHSKEFMPQSIATDDNDAKAGRPEQDGCYALFSDSLIHDKTWCYYSEIGILAQRDYLLFVPENL
jgi:hypothetical protein